MTVHVGADAFVRPAERSEACARHDASVPRCHRAPLNPSFGLLNFQLQSVNLNGCVSAMTLGTRNWEGHGFSRADKRSLIPAL